MADAFNPYQQWLDLPQKSVRPNFYELLSLSQGESDPEKIAQAADRAIAKVRSVRPGDKAKAWAGLIDELNNAKRLLLDPARRAAYDEALKRSNALKPSAPAKPKPQPALVGTSAASPVRANTAKADDPRYPPGVGGKAANQPAQAPQLPTDAVAPATTAYAAESAPNPAAPLQAAVAPQTAAAPAMPAAWPGATQTAMAMPPGGQAYPAYAQPPGYGAPGYPQQPAYVAQPAYPQAAYPGQGYAAPQNFAGAPGYPQQPYGYAAPQAVPIGGPPGGNFDPMAPVAMPMHNPTAPAPMAMPVGAYGAPMASPAMPMGNPVGGAPMAGMPMGGIPMGAASPAAQGAPMGQAVATTAPGPAIGVRTTSAAVLMAANRRKQKNAILMLVGAGLAVVLLSVAGVIAYPYVMGSGEEVAQNDPQTEPEAPATPFPVGGAPGTPTPSAPGTPTVAPPMTPANNGPQTPIAPVPAPSPMSVGSSETPAPATPTTPGTTPAPMPSPPEAMPATPTTPVPTPTTPAPTPETPAPPATPAPTTPTATATPEPPPAPAPMEAKVTREDLLALSKALKTARAAIGEQNFEEADTQLKAAAKFAKTPDLKDKVSRLAQISDMTRQFREAVVAAIQGLDAGEVFQVGGSTQVAVVETFPDKIIVRIAGMNRTYPVTDLPVGLAVALADMQLDTSDPSNRVIKGAYLLGSKNLDADVIEKAKTWWEEAQLGGVDVSKLMPAIDDLKSDYEFKKELAELMKQSSEEAQ